MSDETVRAAREFIESFEEVFGRDWDYTKETLGIPRQTPKQIAEEIAGEAIPFIAHDGTFIEPKVENETEDWDAAACCWNAIDA